MSSTPKLSLLQLSTQIRNGRTTVVDLVEQCLGTINQRDSEINAFIRVLTNQARVQAQQADFEIEHGRDLGVLHGIPISVKDLIDIEGLPTTAASRVRSGHLATTDAPVLARLRAAGAIFIGKCNLNEFAFGTTGEDSAFGPTRNPNAPNHMTGGSSSGSAASVTAGMAVASIGTDTGGSVRIPSAACGVVGLKPTFGELSCEGVVPLGPTLDHVGPIGLTVADVTVIYRTMAGHPAAVGTEPGIAIVAEDEPSQTRLALPRRYFLDLLSDEVRESFEHALNRLREAGCCIEEVTIPHAETIAPTYRNTVLYEALQIHQATLASQGDEYSSKVRHRLEMGRSVSPDAYVQAQVDRKVLRLEVDAILKDFSALVLPTLPIAAPPLGSERVELDGVTWDIRELTLRLTQLFDLTGHPAISVPCGTTQRGLPCAVQLVGRRGETSELLAVASRYEPVVVVRY